jgi:hypothetical protein
MQPSIVKLPDPKMEPVMVCVPLNVLLPVVANILYPVIWVELDTIPFGMLDKSG